MVTPFCFKAARALANAVAIVASGPSPARRVIAPEALSFPFVATCRTIGAGMRLPVVSARRMKDFIERSDVKGAILLHGIRRSLALKGWSRVELANGPNIGCVSARTWIEGGRQMEKIAHESRISRN